MRNTVTFEVKNTINDGSDLLCCIDTPKYKVSVHGKSGKKTINFDFNKFYECINNNKCAM